MRRSSGIAVVVGILALVAATACRAPGTPSPAPPAPAPQPSDTWTIGNERIRLVLRLDGSQGLRVSELRNVETDRDWSKVAAADTVLTVNGAAVGLGTSDGFRYKSAETSSDPSGRELRLTFDHPTLRVRLVRHYICYADAPVIETFTSFQAIGGSASLSNLNAWRLFLPPGPVKWLTGLDVPAEEGDSFTIQRRTLSASQHLDLASPGRSTDTAVPWVSIESGGESFYGGVMWSGAWSISVAAFADRQEVTAGLAAMRTSLTDGAVIDGPHGFFGVASGDAGAVTRGMGDFLERGLRLGRRLQPLITYNTWFARGAAIDEQSSKDDIDHAASLNAELYVVDAGWWPGAAAIDRFDFTSGLGRWVEDPVRFPSGLRALRDYAHERGLQFGIWMEPERVALEVLGEEGMVDEQWLARRDGRYDPARAPGETTSAQICLGDADARAWVREAVFRVLDEVQPDYLKWDNNFWVNCNRGGHGHGDTDGNFAHVRGLYEILEAVRARYPGLLVENCSGGGHRLDLGIARYSDVGWMDDRTVPSVHVRHNLEGLSSVFPGQYLFSFVLGEDGPGGGDMRLLYRSRMPGVLGIGTGMSPEQEAEAAHEIALYRQARLVQQNAAAILLTPQVGSGAGEGWDALQQQSQNGDGIIFAFQNDRAAESLVVAPRGLNPDATYSLESADSGTIGEGTGADIMSQGIEIVASPSTAAHVIFVRQLGGGATSTAARGARHGRGVPPPFAATQTLRPTAKATQTLRRTPVGAADRTDRRDQNR